MPKGIYKRTEKHKLICKKAGLVSHLSPKNILRYKKMSEDICCKECGKVNRYPKSLGRSFCNKVCFDKYQTFNNPTNYSTIHQFIRRNFGTPSKCEHCGDQDSRKFEWANLSGLYKTERSDWMRLCCRCHRRFDFGTKNKIEINHAK